MKVPASYIATQIGEMIMYAVMTDTYTPGELGWAITDKNGTPLYPLSDMVRKTFWDACVDPTTNKRLNTIYQHSAPIRSSVIYSTPNGVQKWYPPTAAQTDFDTSLAECISYAIHTHGIVMHEYDDAQVFFNPKTYSAKAPTDYTIDTPDQGKVTVSIVTSMNQAIHW